MGEFYIVELTQHIAFWVCLLSLGISEPRPYRWAHKHVVLTQYGLEFHHLFIHSSVDRHRGCFHFGAITNQAALNSCKSIFLWTRVVVCHG